MLSAEIPSNFILLAKMPARKRSRNYDTDSSSDDATLGAGPPLNLPKRLPSYNVAASEAAPATFFSAFIAEPLTRLGDAIREVLLGPNEDDDDVSGDDVSEYVDPPTSGLSAGEQDLLGKVADWEDRRKAAEQKLIDAESVVKNEREALVAALRRLRDFLPPTRRPALGPSGGIAATVSAAKSYPLTPRDLIYDVERRRSSLAHAARRADIAASLVDRIGDTVHMFHSRLDTIAGVAQLTELRDRLRTASGSVTAAAVDEHHDAIADLVAEVREVARVQATPLDDICVDTLRQELDAL